MPIIPRIKEQPRGYMTLSIVVMELWETFIGLGFGFSNEVTQCLNKVANEVRTSRS
jgi:hypothetical protein